VTPAVTAQTRANITRFCEVHGIQHKLRFCDEAIHNTDRSRVVAFDRHGLLLRHIGDHRDQWTVDSGQNHNKHGWKVQASYRSKTRPSLQACVVPARGGEYDYMLLIDLDEANPFTDFPAHLWECLRNMGPATTDPAKIAEMLPSPPSE
jgi:hypothetical protein